MKILYITKFIPYPSYGGGLKRNSAWIKFLKKHCEVDVLGFYNKKINDISLFTDNMHYIDYKKNKFKTFILTLFRGGSLIINQYYSIKFIKKLKELMKNNNYDYVFVSEIAMAQYTKYIKNIPILFDDHNVEFELIERTAHYSKFPMNIILYLESKKIKKLENSILNNSFKNFFVSERDLMMFNHNIQQKSIVVNNSFEDRNYNKKELTKHPSLVFVGNLSWKPNKQGLLHFINNIYSKIYENDKNISFRIIGSCLPKEISLYNNINNIEIFENATEEKKDEIIDESWIAVVPVYFGSGTRIKILEYWSHSKVVVSTSIGAEGLIKSNGTYIYDEDLKQIEIIKKLIKNKRRLNELGNNNYIIFKDKYNEEVIYEDSLFKSIFTK